MSSGRLQELKNNRKSLNFQAQKVVAVAYMRWSFTRGSNCKALTGKIAVFRIGGRLWEVVAYEKWSHMEVRLYMPDKGHVIIIIINTQGQIAQMYFIRKDCLT